METEEKQMQCGEQTEKKPAECGEQTDKKPAECGEQTDKKPAECGEQTDKKPAECGEQTDKKPAECGEQTEEKQISCEGRSEEKQTHHSEKRQKETLRRTVGIAAALAILGGGFLGIKEASVINKAAAQEMREEQTAKENEGRNSETASVKYAILGKKGASKDGADASAAPEDEALAEDALSVAGMAVQPSAIYTGGPLFEAHSTDHTAGFQDTIASRYGIMIDVESGEILAQKDAQERMNPASMTKILTLLVAAENISWEELEDTETVTIDITDYCYLNNCSITGHALGEAVTVRDLFYGTILPSGADSAMTLAVYAAGSQEAFVDLMNEKLEEMGLAETTHFTNCVGMYDEEHYSTAYDIAMILKAAVDNEFCRDVLSRRLYKTEATEQNPEGLWAANKFLRNIQELDTHGEVFCAKTGYVEKAGCCAASLCLGNDGREYLCVTAGAPTSKICMEDQAELYRTFISE